MRRGAILPARGHEALGDGRVARARPRRPRTTRSRGPPIRRRGLRRVVAAPCRTPRRTGDHSRLQDRTAALLPRRARNPSPDGHLPRTRLQRRPRPTRRLRRHPRQHPRRHHRRPRRRRHHRRLHHRPAQLLPPQTRDPSPDGHLPRQSPRPHRCAHTHLTGRVQDGQRRRRPHVRDPHRRHHHLLGRQLPRAGRPPAGYLRVCQRRQAPHLCHTDRQHNRMLGTQLRWAVQPSRGRPQSRHSRRYPDLRDPNRRHYRMLGAQPREAARPSRRRIRCRRGGLSPRLCHRR